MGTVKRPPVPPASAGRARIGVDLVEHFRRTDPRYDRQVDVEIKSGGKELLGRSRNVSLGGMFVEVVGDPLPAGTAVEVRFRVPTQPEVIEVAGEVRWLEKAAEGRPAGVGIRFHGLRARDVWALNRFFQL